MNVFCITFSIHTLTEVTSYITGGLGGLFSEAVLRPLVCCAREQLSLCPSPLVTPLETQTALRDSTGIVFY